MSKKIFVSLPVTDVKASRAFYESLGFRNNPRFPDDTAAWMVWSEDISFMLLSREKWQTMTTRPIPPSTSSEVMLALSLESRDADEWPVVQWPPLPPRTAARPTSIQSKIMGSCTPAILPTPMAMLWARCGWICPQCPRTTRRVERVTNSGLIKSVRVGPPLAFMRGTAVTRRAPVMKYCDAMTWSVGIAARRIARPYL